jgi:FAD/FMN-containing dehydrogenase
VGNGSRVLASAVRLAASRSLASVTMARAPAAGVVVNDIHSQLNETTVREVVEVDSLEAVRVALGRARDLDVPLSVAGGRHAMGGQQFCGGGLLLDTRQLGRVLDLDAEAGVVEVEAGIQWPALLEQSRPTAWGFRQKQTGADRLSLGGAVSANGHGRGLAMRPIVGDVESLQLVCADGEVRTCSRDENPDLFALVAGGYGLFGAIYSLRLRLMRRRKLERVVELRELDGLVGAFEERIASGFLYGDFQFAIDPAGDGFLRRGVFSCYLPVDDDDPIPPGQRALTTDDWSRLLYLTHTNKAQAFEHYAAHYLATSGQLYWSDAHQSAEYIDDYHRSLDYMLGGRATEMISELYVPRDRLTDFMEAVAEDFRANGVDVIYGTVRLIERDDESFLAWAREPWACVIFNLHTVHTPEGIEHSADAFRRLIDLAIDRGGSYFLTYHRWARRDQVEACYPQFREFLARKRRHDPDELFQSDWYRHHVGLLSGE